MPARPELRAFGPSELDDLTSAPAVYGFHGTVVPPFHLADDGPHALDDLDRVVHELAARIAPIVVPSLRIGMLGAFVAFRPAEPCAPLDRLAAECVTRLAPLRRPPDDLDVVRRRRAGLTPRQEELLVEWGYPYVFDEFRYHMTLTRDLAPAEVADVLAAAQHWFGELDGAPYVVDDLTVLVQTGRGEPFVEHARHALGAGGSPPGTGL